MTIFLKINRSVGFNKAPAQLTFLVVVLDREIFYSFNTVRDIQSPRLSAKFKNELSNRNIDAIERLLRRLLTTTMSHSLVDM